MEPYTMEEVGGVYSQCLHMWNNSISNTSNTDMCSINMQMQILALHTPYLLHLAL